MTKQDLIELSEDYTLQINDNTVTLYHATRTEHAEQIISTQKMYGKEDGLFFSSIPNGQIEGYGNVIIEVEIPINRIQLNDQFDNELHFRMPCKPYTLYNVIAKQF